MNMRFVLSMIAGLVLIVGAWIGFMDNSHVTSSPVPDVSSETTTNDTHATTNAAPVTTTSVAQETTVGTSVIVAASGLDVTNLPLGDGKVSAAPQVGYTYSCESSFRGGGAEHAGGWIHGSTWNLNEKIAVEGAISWPNATFSDTIQASTRLITGNGLPVGTKTGIFPIAASDPAYQYDRNPNGIQTQNIRYSLPASPAFAASPSCLPMGAIGIALNGVAIYNSLDDAGRDAVAHEVQDSCEGHPQVAGQYHYHGPSSCIPHAEEKDTVIGYALDGYAITSLYGANGKLYANADLDTCHGTTSAYIDESGKTVTAYHYVLTWEYPYTLGCFRGTPVSGHLMGGGGGPTNTPPAGQGGTPPAAAIAACSGKAINSSCSFATPNGTISGMCRNTPDGSTACVPN